MTTTNRIKAGTAYGCTTAGCNYPEGGCMDTCAFNLHRIDASLLKDDRAVMVAGESTLPNATEFAEPEPIDWASFRPLVIAGLVLCIAGLFYWGFA